MSESQPIGQLPDSLGVTSTIAPDGLPVAALVLLKVVDATGDVRPFADVMAFLVTVTVFRLARSSKKKPPGLE